MARPLIYGKIEIDYTAAGGTATLEVFTDKPGSAMASRITPRTLPIQAARSPRVEALPGNVIGKLLRLKITPASGCTLMLFGIRVWAKVLNAGGAWQWYVMPNIAPTTDDYVTVPFPIPPPSDELATINFPNLPPSGDMVTVPLPIPAPSDEMATVPLGLDLQPFRWISVPVQER